MIRLRLLLAAALTAAALIASVPQAHAAFSPRTLRLSLGINGVDANGDSSRPSLSSDGLYAAFDSTASTLAGDPNGKVRDVFVRDIGAQATRLVTLTADGAGGNGPSSSPSIGGSTIAFVSAASNLVPDDVNGHRDVFVELFNSARFIRVSEPAGGGQADGDSRSPKVSADGRFVVFTSSATNLLPGDHNGKDDVYLRDLATGALQRISDVAGVAANGTSNAPSISADGHFVSFASDAPDLVQGDSNATTDIFVLDRGAPSLERVSISTVERQQNASVIAPFEEVSDISADGRFVAFDSDATNLVRGDTNKDTDVFVRDRLFGTTERVSVTTRGRQGDNDSFNPVITADGRRVAFDSFAGNLAPRDARREDVFIHDRRTHTTAIVDVTILDQPRLPELVPQLLQRPALSADGTVAAFTSTAPKVVEGDANRAEDVFLRRLDPPHARFLRDPRQVGGRRLTFRVRIDDPHADRLKCTVDRREFACGRHGGTTPRLNRGRHTVRVYGGGIGMLFETGGSTRRAVIR